MDFRDTRLVIEFGAAAAELSKAGFAAAVPVTAQSLAVHGVGDVLDGAAEARRAPVLEGAVAASNVRDASIGPDRLDPGREPLAVASGGTGRRSFDDPGRLLVGDGAGAVGTTGPGVSWAADKKTLVAPELELGGWLLADMGGRLVASSNGLDVDLVNPVLVPGVDVAALDLGGGAVDLHAGLHGAPDAPYVVHFRCTQAQAADPPSAALVARRATASVRASRGGRARVAVSGLAAGAWTVYAAAEDGRGNVGAVSSADVVL